MLEVLSAAPLLKNAAPDASFGDPLAVAPASGFVSKPDYRPLTKFENRGRKLGHGVWDVVFERV